MKNLASWIHTNIVSILAFVMLFGSSNFHPVDKQAFEQMEYLRDKSDNLSEQICELQEALLSANSTIGQLNEQINDPFVLAHQYQKERKAYSDFLRQERTYPSTPFEFAPYLTRPDISEELLAALVAYGQFDHSKCGTLVVTSAYRPHNPLSRHSHKNAIDISSRSGDIEDFLCWLEGEEGRSWLAEYGLNFYIEDTHWSNFLFPWRERLDDFIFVNPYATGPHVHLEYVGK